MRRGRKGLFADRHEAGSELAERLFEYRRRKGAIVLGLPRGGVPVAFEVARHLSLPLDVFIVRKLGVPFHEELAMGAIASGGITVFNEPIVSQVPGELVETAVERESREIDERERLYRQGRPPLDLLRKTVILVDDGLATGASMRVAVSAVKKSGANQVVVAVPVAPQDTCAALKDSADRVICARTPEPFVSVGLWYDDFTQTSDAEVIALLRENIDGVQDVRDAVPPV